VWNEQSSGMSAHPKHDKALWCLKYDRPRREWHGASVQLL